MYAIVEIAGQQFKVEKEQELFVHRLEGDAGSSVEFDNVLLFENDGKVTVGTPEVDGVAIKAKIVEHLKGDKVTVFHKKRRKGYQKENGHRQYLSKILIEDILTGVKKSTKKEVIKETPKKEVKAEVKAEKPKEAPVAKAEPKEITKKEEAPKAETKKEEKPKTAPKEEAVKKEDPKAEKKEAKPKAEPKAEKTNEEKPKVEKKEDNIEEK